jgi:uncharacterized protein (DUF58 family)
MTNRAHLLEGEAVAARFALAAPRNGPVNRSGSVLGSQAGSSLEFRDYRAYEAGDDLRHIDWNAYARSDQLNVKLYREEVLPHLDMLIDGSRSMALADTAKARATLALAGFFTSAAANAGYSHAGWLLSGMGVPLGDRHQHPLAWEGVRFDLGTSPLPALSSAAARFRPRSVRILLSDLMWDADPARVVRQIVDRAASAVVIQVLAREDADPALNGYVQLVDCETGELRELRVDRAMLDRYLSNLHKLQGHWHDCCRSAGVIFVVVIAEDLLDDWRQIDPLMAAGMLQVY